jgi:hypothetical protein
MIRMIRFGSFVSMLLLSLCSLAQSDSAVIKKIADEVMMNGKAYEKLRYLCKQIGPRLSGSPPGRKGGIGHRQDAERKRGPIQFICSPAWFLIGLGVKRK